MSAYFHAKSVGFYTDEVHGPRTILVVDPKWKQPEIKIADPDWVPSDDEEGAEAPLISVPDPDAVPPLIEVPNPKCSLPPKAELRDLPLDKYLALLAAQSQQGKVIQANSKGEPVAVDPPPPSDVELERRERRWRDTVLASTDALVARHRDELEVGSTTLSIEQYQLLQAFRLELRNWPASSHFPLLKERPVAPAWLADQLQ